MEKKVFYKMYMLEYDCEKRAIELIKHLKLEINLRDYIKQANAYLLFYKYYRITKKWYGKIPPYESDIILKEMPDVLINPYTKLSKKYYNLFSAVLNN